MACLHRTAHHVVGGTAHCPPLSRGIIHLRNGPILCTLKHSYQQCSQTHSTSWNAKKTHGSNCFKTKAGALNITAPIWLVYTHVVRNRTLSCAPKGCSPQCGFMDVAFGWNRLELKSVQCWAAKYCHVSQFENSPDRACMEHSRLSTQEREPGIGLHTNWRYPS